MIGVLDYTNNILSAGKETSIMHVDNFLVSVFAVLYL